MRLNNEGNPQMSADPDASPYYLEAELNSPMCRLRAGESCSFETEWFPTRSGAEFHGSTDAGILIRPLEATALHKRTRSASPDPLVFSIPVTWWLAFTMSTVTWPQ